MTYTIMAADRTAGQVGIGLATVSINAASLVPFYSAHGHVIATQAYAEKALGPVMVGVLNGGASPDEAIAAARSADGRNEAFRQLAVVSPDGETACHTGPRCRSWAGHTIGDGWIAMGNVLAGSDVVDAIATAFAASGGKPLAERLLLALEAGRDAGGQATIDGRALRERSAFVRVIQADLLPIFDVQVDLNEDAVGEVRRIADVVTAIEPYNRIRSADPAATPAIPDWEAANVEGLPIPSPFR
ncbi:MAG: DUF1028 domain-containing protein [Alphaproteobacteria bacterium]